MFVSSAITKKSLFIPNAIYAKLMQAALIQWQERPFIPLDNIFDSLTENTSPEDVLMIAGSFLEDFAAKFIEYVKIENRSRLCNMLDLLNNIIISLAERKVSFAYIESYWQRFSSSAIDIRTWEADVVKWKLSSTLHQLRHCSGEF
jgi:hypothetical protein